MRVAVLNGPNLNLLGTREPSVYGTTTLGEIEARLVEVGRELGVEVLCRQHNGEGQLIDAIHELAPSVEGFLVNAGAYTHTSLALRDALTGVARPFIEVHLSNIFAREPERHHSMLAPAARAILSGFGPVGYELALRGLVSTLGARRSPAAGARA